MCRLQSNRSGSASTHPEHRLASSFQRLGEFLGGTDGDELTSGASRFVLWDYAWREILSAPFLGHGYDNFRYVSETWLNGMFEPHNNVLQILYAGGTLGLGAFLTLIWAGLKGRSRDDETVTLTLLVLAFYVLVTIGDIIWLRGSGHLFWLLFFAIALPRRLAAPHKVPHS